MKHFSIVGLSHYTAEVEARERAAVPVDELEKVLSDLCSRSEIDEAMLLSTCNRVELYVVGEHVAPLARRASEFFERRSPNAETYRHDDEGAVRHLFRVAASLDSMVVGEPQILGQLKDAFDFARGNVNSAGPFLHRVMHKAFECAKAIRTDTQVAAGNVSISSVATGLARKIFGELDGRKALLLGAGEMGRSAAEHLSKSGAKLEIINRSETRAQELSNRLQAKWKPLEQLHSALVDSDIVVSSTSSPNFVIDYSAMKKVSRKRRGNPLFLIDIAVPRDIDPKTSKLDGVFLYNVDDLQQVANENLDRRQQEKLLAEEIVASRVVAFRNWVEQNELKPTIMALREEIASIVGEELDRATSELDLSDAEKERLERMARAITNKISHRPIASLRSSRSPDHIAAVRDIFGIENEPEPQDSAERRLSELTPAKNKS